MILTAGLPALAIVALAFAGCFCARGADDQAVPYPEGYRHWTYLHSSLIPPKLPGFWKRPCEKPCTAGIFNFYANEKAMTGLRAGVYPDGAVIAEELLEILGSASGGGKEGERRLVGVMVKDSQRYASTGGWGFGSYDAPPGRINLIARPGTPASHAISRARITASFSQSTAKDRSNVPVSSSSGKALASGFPHIDSSARSSSPVLSCFLASCRERLHIPS